MEYNFGRSFDHFGVAHLAIEHYERVLVSVQRRMEEAGMEMEPIQTPEVSRRAFSGRNGGDGRCGRGW